LGGFGATISAAFSWHTTFHFFGLAGIVYSLILIVFLKEKDRDVKMISSDKMQGNHRKSLYKILALLFSNISFWMILIYFAVPSLPGWATKNWLPTLFSEGLGIPMAKAGPISTVAIAASSFLGVLFGGVLSDRWVVKNIRGRIYTSAIGLALTIPSLLLIGFGHTLFSVVSAALCFGVGWGMYDANNMPILCQFVSEKHRATAYGIMNMAGVFSGALITDLLGKSTEAGHLGSGFAMLAAIVLIAVIIQLSFLRPKAIEYVD